MTRPGSGFIYRLAIAALLAPMVLMSSGRAPEALAQVPSGSSVVSGFACPSGLTPFEYGNDAGELENGFIKDGGTLTFGGATIKVTAPHPQTGMKWEMTTLPTPVIGFGGIDAIVVHGVAPDTLQPDGSSKVYTYSPEATSTLEVFLTDNVPTHRITHVLFCVDFPVLGNISGNKWNDIDADREFLADAPPEHGLGFWTINLHNGPCSPSLGTLNDTTTTAPGTGAYSFPPKLAGTYCVVEVPTAGWTQTAPNRSLPSLNFGSTSNTDGAGTPVSNKWQVTITALVPDPSGINFGNRGLGCPPTLIKVAEYGDSPSELSAPPSAYIIDGSLPYGAATITIDVNPAQTSFTWSLAGPPSGFGGVDAVVVWGVNGATGGHDGASNVYQYSPEAFSDFSGLTDNNPAHKITHVLFCGDPGGPPPPTFD